MRGADKNYDVAEFVKAMRDHGVTSHVTQKKVGSAIDRRTTRHAGYAVSLKKRKLVEEIFGWAKTVGGLRKARFIGLAKVKAQTAFILAVYNLMRLTDKRPESRKGDNKTAEIRVPGPAIALPNPVRRHQWSVAKDVRGNFNILLTVYIASLLLSNISSLQ